MPKADACFKVLRVKFQGRSVQQQVKTGEGEGARRNIGGRHVVCVGEQVEGLNTAAGPHIEGTRHGGALGNLRQGQGCLPNTQHVVLAQHPGSLMRPQIGGHPQLGAVISRMRAQVKHGAVARFFAGILGGAGIF